MKRREKDEPRIDHAMETGDSGKDACSTGDCGGTWK